MSKSRDRQYLKNIIQMLIFQGGAHLAGLVILPLSLGYLDATRYGLWLVIGSVFTLIGSFDLGLANGLRNKLSESLALKNFDISRKYVSTAYFLITLIATGILGLFLVFQQFLNWGELFNAPGDMHTEFNKLIILCITFYSVNFVFNLIIIVLTADQKIGLSRLYGFWSSILVLVAVFLLNTFAESSLLYLCMAMIVPPFIVLLGMNAYLFATIYKDISPSISFIEFSLGKDLVRLGAKFFILGIGTTILLSTDNIIITTLFGPEAVTPYNIALQYNAIAMGLFGIVLAPSWSAYTEAHTLNEESWISKTLFRLIAMWFCLLPVVVIFVLISQPVYEFWIGSEIVIPNSLTILMAVFVAQSSFNSIFSHYLHGVGRIDLILRVLIVVGVINIPLSVVLARECGLGSDGVIIATIICAFLGTIIAPLQAYFLLTHKAKGIWNR